MLLPRFRNLFTRAKVRSDPPGDYRWYAWDKDEAAAWLKERKAAVDGYHAEANFHTFRVMAVDDETVEEWITQWQGPVDKSVEFNPKAAGARPVKLTLVRKNETKTP
ncbi:hypothetical protein JW905_03560 [bacterium]|nr:hypothetical protein [candidate division CSSED10-310 bacterium]